MIYDTAQLSQSYARARDTETYVNRFSVNLMKQARRD